MGGYFALWQNELISQGYGFTDIAGIVTVQTLVGIVLNVPTGILADRIGHRRTTQIGYFLYALAFLLPAFASSARLISYAVILVGVGGAVLDGALESWATAAKEKYDQGVKSKRFMERDQAQRVGMIAGALMIPGAVGLFGHRFGFPWTVFFGLALALVVASVSMKDGIVEEKKCETMAPWLLSRENWRMFLASRRQQLLFLGIFVFGMADGVVSTVFWPTVRSYGIASVAAFGLIQTSQSLSRLVGLHFWKKAHWNDHDSLPGGVLIGSGLLFVAFSFATGAGAGLTLWLLRIAVLSAYFSALQAMMVRDPSIRAARATILSLSTVVSSLGTVFATSLISVVGNGVSLGRVAAGGGVLTIVAGIAMLRAATVGRVAVPEALS